MNQEQETLATELRNCAAYVESGRDALEGAGRGRELARLARRAADVLSALLSRTEQAEAERDALKARASKLDEDWFDEVEDFLDDYSDAEIIDGLTHPNKAMRLLCQLREARP